MPHQSRWRRRRTKLYASGYEATERIESSPQLPMYQNMRLCCSSPLIQLRCTWFRNQNQRLSDCLPGLLYLSCALCAYQLYAINCSRSKEIRRSLSMKLQDCTFQNLNRITVLKKFMPCWHWVEKGIRRRSSEISFKKVNTSTRCAALPSSLPKIAIRIERIRTRGTLEGPFIESWQMASQEVIFSKSVLRLRRNFSDGGGH